MQSTYVFTFHYQPFDDCGAVSLAAYFRQPPIPLCPAEYNVTQTALERMQLNKKQTLDNIYGNKMADRLGIIFFDVVSPMK